jgi:hypothetical protein
MWAVRSSRPNSGSVDLYGREYDRLQLIRQSLGGRHPTPSERDSVRQDTSFKHSFDWGITHQIPRESLAGEM